ncbi:MAG: hypothetical protein ABIP51_19255 [Bacteroidia bacterium]
MKKIILIGASLLIASTAIVLASTSNCTTGCEDCPFGICKPTDKCLKTDCCKK